MNIHERTGRFWSDNAWLGVATVVAGVFNTLYSVFLAHALGPADYGRIVALNNLVGLLLLPLPIIGLMAIRVGKQPHQRWVVLGALAIGGAMFLLAVWLSPLGARVFHVHQSLIVLFAASVLLNFAYALYIGFLERARRYGLVGLLLVIASALSLMAVVVAVTMGHQHPIAWLGGAQLLALFILFLIARFYSQQLPSLPRAPLKRVIVATTLGVGSLQAFWGLTDSLWAKAHLPAVTAGLYTGLATIGQALPFAVSSLATVMLTAILDEPQDRRRYLLRTLLMTGALAMLFIAVLALFPEIVVRLALGSQFIPMTSLIQRYSDAMVALSFVLVLTTYGVAVGALRTMVAAGIGTLFWMVWLSGADTMEALVRRTLISMGVTLGLVLLAFFIGEKEITGSPNKGAGR